MHNQSKSLFTKLLRALLAIVLFIVFSNRLLAKIEDVHTVSSISWNYSNPDLIAVGYNDGIIEIWDVTENEIRETLQIDSRTIVALQWSHDGNLLASSHYQGQTTTVNIWNLAISTPSSTGIELGTEIIRSLQFTITNNELMTFDTFRGVRVWNTSNGSLIDQRELASLNSDLHVASNRLVTAPNGPIFLIWDLSVGYQGNEFSQLADNGIPVLEQGITTITWNQGGTQVATGENNGNLRVWTASTSPIVTTLLLRANDVSTVDYDTSAVRAVTFLNNDAEVATVSADGRVRSWNVNSGQLLLDYSLEQSITAAEFSPDGTQIAYGTSDGSTPIIIDNH